MKGKRPISVYVSSPYSKGKSRMTIPDKAGVDTIKARVSIGAITGCWFRTYTKGIIASYGEKRAYPPTEICSAVFIINPHTGFLDVSRSP